MIMTYNKWASSKRVGFVFDIKQIYTVETADDSDFLLISFRRPMIGQRPACQEAEKINAYAALSIISNDLC